MLREALGEERASREEDLHNKDSEIATLQAKVTIHTPRTRFYFEGCSFASDAPLLSAGISKKFRSVCLVSPVEPGQCAAGAASSACAKIALVGLSDSSFSQGNKPKKMPKSAHTQAVACR